MLTVNLIRIKARSLRLEMIRMSKYFSDEELVCHGERADNVERYGRGCGCGARIEDAGISEKLLTVLDAIRERVGAPVSLNCTYRCPVHNANVGGGDNSFHMQGLASDVACPEGMSELELEALALECGADTARAYVGEGFCHVDMRGYRAYW